MAANILRSAKAIQMSVFVVRAFIRMRQMLIEQRGLARKLAALEEELTARLDVHETAINEMLGQIKRLLSLPPEPEPEGSWWKNRMYPTNPQKDLKSRKGNEPFWRTATEMELLGSIDARKASSELTPNPLRFTSNS
jgi:hypothetical protein